MIEITVILKQEDKTYKEKFLCYEQITVSQDDETLKGYLAQAKANLKGEPEEVIFKISYTL